jgi:cytochrome c oxidase subunit 3
VAITGTVWYWHFVDIVWLVVFAVVYYWGSSTAAASLASVTH